VQNWLGLARAAHYFACTGLFGLCLFSQYERLFRWNRTWTLVLSAGALATGLAWYGLVTFNLAEALDADALGAVASQTGFGRVWVARLLLAVVVTALAASAKAKSRWLTVLTLLLLSSIALTGHTQVHPGFLGAVHVAADAAHLAAAGAWLGGLIGLAAILGRKATEATAHAQVAAGVSAFSSMAQVAVAVLVVTGLVNAALLVGSIGGLISSQYGAQLLVKLTFVAGMLALAVVNRFALSPKLTAPGSETGAIRRLRRNVMIEQALGVGVLLSVGWLGLSDPPA
jgi:putative copper resistance protein D